MGNVDYSFSQKQFDRKRATSFKELANKITEVVVEEKIPSFSLLGLLGNSMNFFADTVCEPVMAAMFVTCDEKGDCFHFISILSSMVNEIPESICTSFLTLKAVPVDPNAGNVIKARFGKSNISSVLRGAINKYEGIVTPHLNLIIPILSEIHDHPGCVYRAWEENDYEKIAIEFYANGELLQLVIDHSVLEKESKAFERI